MNETLIMLLCSSILNGSNIGIRISLILDLMNSCVINCIFVHAFWYIYFGC
jgi:hypothetical protein